MISQRSLQRAGEAVARLTDQLDAMRKGTFTGPGDSRNDVPYSRQRIHEVTLQQLAEEARLREHQARIVELERRIASEQERLEKRSGSDVKAPVRGILWRQLVAPGSPVMQRTELLQLVDVSTLFVDATVNVKFADRIHPSDPVLVRLVGSDLEMRGTVRHVAGEGTLREDRSLAVQCAEESRHQVHVVIDLGTVPGGGDSNQFYVGRRVEVDFPNVAGSVLGLR
jgi:multidrug resistance efflux pump